MKTSESRYIEKKGYLTHYAQEGTVALREANSQASAEKADNPQWAKTAREKLTRFIPFLSGELGIEFRGRILEIGAGSAWLSAEISKLPKVVEIITTDFSPRLLKEEAPKVFKLLDANAGKITRMPADYHKLDFPPGHFDYVICSSALHSAANIVQVLREVKRVLKPGGQLVAIREPVLPIVPLKSRSKPGSRRSASSPTERFYTLAHYKEFFKQAGLPLEAKRVNLSHGFKYYFNVVVNGLTHARYAFIGTRPGRISTAPTARKEVHSSPLSKRSSSSKPR